METPNASGSVHIDRFLPVVAKIFIDRRFQAAGVDQIRRAFKAKIPSLFRLDD